MNASELNSPREMVERATYVLYLGSLVAGSYLSVVALIVIDLGTALAAMGTLVAAALLRWLGMAKLQFAAIERELSESSPFAADREFGRRVAELRGLFDRLENVPMSSQERQRLRRQIVSLLAGDEVLVDHFWPRLRHRHPYLIRSL